mmetsp:Transcript_26473/g.83920  ORF Transcript_26473/g.83920 Transcript_26473/m.83920 type:complete len:97 (-) Transcript_26473:595-885(-)
MAPPLQQLASGRQATKRRVFGEMREACVSLAPKDAAQVPELLVLVRAEVAVADREDGGGTAVEAAEAPVVGRFGAPGGMWPPGRGSCSSPAEPRKR